MSISAGSMAILDAGARTWRVRRILVPLDGSRRAAAALPYALALAHATAARINLLAIVEPLHVQAGLPSHTGQEDDERRVALNAAYLDSVAIGLRARGLTVEAAVRHDDPASAIVAASTQEGGALVVMGTHGQTGLARLRAGSVAQRVLRHAAIATLVVPPGAAESLGGEATIAAITVALDGSALAEVGLPLAASLVAALNVPLNLLSVIPGLALLSADNRDEGYYGFPRGRGTGARG